MLTAYLVDSPDDTVLDDELTTLREALEAANTNTALWDGDIPAGSDTETDVITFDSSLSGGTITLAGTQLEITDTAAGVDIQGPGAELLAIDADEQSRVFYVGSGAEASLWGLSITGGSADYGGGIYSYYGTLSSSKFGWLIPQQVILSVAKDLDCPRRFFATLRMTMPGLDGIWNY